MLGALFFVSVSGVSMYEAGQGTSTIGNAFRHVGILTPIVTNRGFTCEDGPNVPAASCYTPIVPDRHCAMPWDQRYLCVAY